MLPASILYERVLAAHVASRRAIFLTTPLLVYEGYKVKPYCSTFGGFQMLALLYCTLPTFTGFAFQLSVVLLTKPNKPSRILHIHAALRTKLKG